MFPCLRPAGGSRLLCTLPLLLASLTAGAAGLELKPASELALPDSQQASAAVLAPNDTLIAAEISATVATVHVESGRSVDKGALLVSLDPRDARLALAQSSAQLQAASARLTLAEQRAERGRELRANKHVSEDELLALETGLIAARAEVALARAGRDAAARQLEKCELRAPFDGVVLERQAQVGALAAPGSPLLRLVSVQAPEVEAQLSEEAARTLENGREFALLSQGRRYPLELLALSPVLERSSRTRLARFGFTDEAAPAGSTGSVSWVGPQLLMPAELMVKRDGLLGAFVEENGLARFVAAPGAEEGRPFRIAIEAQVRVVSSGQQSLNAGDALDQASSPANALEADSPLTTAPAQ